MDSDNALILAAAVAIVSVGAARPLLLRPLGGGSSRSAAAVEPGGKAVLIIEDDAFIGSDTQLVAPVTVGRGATLGAGTTLTKDAPPDTLTISRARQTSIPGWKRPVKQPGGKSKE